MFVKPESLSQTAAQAKLMLLTLIETIKLPLSDPKGDIIIFIPDADAHSIPDAKASLASSRNRK